MKRITEYKKLFEVTTDLNLKDLKSTYRGLVKEWHPDKFNGDEVKLQEAELMSKKIIEAYHFLVSLAPETLEANLEEYTTTINAVGIEDFSFEKQVLKVHFKNETSYEYFGVPHKLYIKLCNSSTQYRFLKRHVFSEKFLYRKLKSKSLEN